MPASGRGASPAREWRLWSGAERRAVTKLYAPAGAGARKGSGEGKVAGLGADSERRSSSSWGLGYLADAAAAHSPSRLLPARDSDAESASHDGRQGNLGDPLLCREHR